MSDSDSCAVSHWQFIVPLILNQLGSVFNIYALGPGGAELSVAIPVVTTLTFVFTAITSWAIGEPNPQSKSEHRSLHMHSPVCEAEAVCALACRNCTRHRVFDSWCLPVLGVKGRRQRVKVAGAPVSEARQARPVSSLCAAGGVHGVDLGRGRHGSTS